MQATDIHLYGFRLSGHCHRVELLLSLLGLGYRRTEVDLAAGEHKRPAFLAKNAFGQVPVLEDGALTLADSNAILTYLALCYDQDRRFMPGDAAGAARMQRWLSVAAGPLAQGPASARAGKLFGSPVDVPRAQGLAAQLFAVLEAELTTAPFLAGERATLADVACYAYVARAPEGGVDLKPYTALERWLARVEQLPGFVPMPRAGA
jgi:glutathione S-transferase